MPFQNHLATEIDVDPDRGLTLTAIRTTPSGSDEFHGSVYWYNRNSRFSANGSQNFFLGDQLLDSTSFGRLMSTAFDRRIVPFALKYSF